MYEDYSPHPVPEGVEQVVVLEEGDVHTADEVIEFADEVGATSFDGEDIIFWIVFPANPRRAWDFTEKALRQQLERLHAE